MATVPVFEDSMNKRRKGVGFGCPYCGEQFLRDRELRRHWDNISRLPTMACRARKEHRQDCEDYVQYCYRMRQAMNPGEAMGNLQYGVLHAQTGGTTETMMRGWRDLVVWQEWKRPWVSATKGKLQR